MSSRDLAAGLLVLSIATAPFCVVLATTANAVPVPAQRPLPAQTRLTATPAHPEFVPTETDGATHLVRLRHTAAASSAHERDTAGFLDGRTAQVAGAAEAAMAANAVAEQGAADELAALVQGEEKPLPSPAFDLAALRVAAERAGRIWAGRRDLQPPTGTQQPNPAALTAVSYALAQVGDPYVWAAEGPNYWDCSALMRGAYRMAGFELPRVSRQQFLVGEWVDRPDLLPGDLVFFAYRPGDPASIHHVGMYLGGGLMVHAPRTGDVVRISPVMTSGYAGAVRVAPAVAAAGGKAGAKKPAPATAPKPAPSPSAATPTPSAAGKAAPKELVPTESVPTESVPTESVPSESPSGEPASGEPSPSGAPASETPQPPSPTPPASATATPEGSAPAPTAAPSVTPATATRPTLVAPTVAPTVIAVPPGTAMEGGATATLSPLLPRAIYPVPRVSAPFWAPLVIVNP